MGQDKPSPGRLVSPPNAEADVPSKGSGELSAGETGIVLDSSGKPWIRKGGFGDTTKRTFRALRIGEPLRAQIVGLFVGVLLGGFISHRLYPPVQVIDSHSSQLVWGLQQGQDTSGKFNDFQLVPETGGGAVQFLWADPFWDVADPSALPAIIWAQLLKSDHALRVHFRRVNAGCNIAIRPKSAMPAVVHDKQYLTIRFRSPSSKPVGLRVRLVDENNVHWAFGRPLVTGTDPNLKFRYSSSAKNARLGTSSSEWQTVQLPLDKENWVHFYFDGPSLNIPAWETIRQRPFGLVFLVIFEVGFEPSGRPGESVDNMSRLERRAEEGVVDLGGISFD
ncbi:MAG TPA: hypothetical protein VHR45_24980 [Thermoanaerobaculia bacterium]|nr:hypothetical protein [Thermoanaerobaculia bacterium]